MEWNRTQVGNTEMKLNHSSATETSRFRKRPQSLRHNNMLCGILRRTTFRPLLASPASLCLILSGLPPLPPLATNLFSSSSSCPASQRLSFPFTLLFLSPPSICLPFFSFLPSACTSLPSLLPSAYFGLHVFHLPRPSQVYGSIRPS